MDSNAKDFLQRMLETPSPSGYERPVQDVVREYVADFADEVTTDTHGNVIVRRGDASAPRVYLAGHCDQIGLLVSYVSKGGFLYMQTVGGWDPQQLVGQHVTVWAKEGPIPGVVARKAIHLLTPEERNKVVDIKSLWIDIGAKDKDEALELVRIGDPVTFELGMRELRSGLAASPKMDNTTGVWVVIEALRRAKDLKVCMYSVSTVQEEIGLRGARTSAFGIDPQVGIAVDVTHATDCPTISKFQEGEINLGDGPVVFRGPNINPIVGEGLLDTAEAQEIPVQLAAVGRATPNDANAIQLTRGGVATGLVSIPNRYMHSAVETISLDDIDHAADLLSAYVSGLDGTEDFTP
ncbi:MAG: M42 family metallopeptidase [Acidobacteriota bacterium]